MGQFQLVWYSWSSQRAKKKEGTEKNLWRNNGQKFSKFDENCKLRDPRISTNAKQAPKSTPRYSIIEWIKISDKREGLSSNMKKLVSPSIHSFYFCCFAFLTMFTGKNLRRQKLLLASKSLSCISLWNFPMCFPLGEYLEILYKSFFNNLSIVSTF